MTSTRNRNLPLSLLVAASVALGCGGGGSADASAADPADPPAAGGQEASPSPAPAAQPGVADPAPAGATSAPPPGASEPVLPSDQIPDVVARIDGRELTRADLLARASEARGALAQRGIPSQPTRSFYRKVLDDLIGNALVYRELDAQGKAASAKEIDDQIASIRAPFESDQAFEEALNQRGFDRERLRREVAESLTVNHWIEQTVLPSIEVTDDQVREFYQANLDKMVEPERVRARHVLVSAPASASAEQRQAARKKIDELRAKIQGGADFAEVARQSSDDKNSGARGGDLGWFYRGQMVPSFDQAAFSLEPGAVSEVVESPFGYHLIQVQEHQQARTLDLDTVREELRKRIRQHELEQTVRSHLDELTAKAKIERYL